MSGYDYYGDYPPSWDLEPCCDEPDCDCAAEARRAEGSARVAIEQAWWRDVGSVLLGLTDDEDDE